MSKYTEQEILKMALMIGLVLFVIEFIFLEPGSLFLLALAGAGMFIGWRSFETSTGKVFFWGGVFFLFIAVINTFAIRFFLVSIAIYFGWKWYQGNKQLVHKYIPTSTEEPVDSFSEGVKSVQKEWFGRVEKGEQPYSWEDMNVQAIVGELVIDLNNTMLPSEDAVIVCRHLVGTIRIIVPYDVDIVIDHSVLYGDVQIFEKIEKGVFNRRFNYETNESPQRIKIYSQMLAGKLEVVRG
ncbi:lia operon protein LiaF [Gracilibacillus halotolerans]|uniref:Lia operon protein LiaF n=1 Tax=Gracilibacillus halotolerans TaxID=74386 RepID=A0A841RMC0_9BACI|nr:cell wall-active antibiotics response protein LiaF [Gracilibacillus halotolerans]MBB6513027.1 lia operon protein LiaF [Gracilibacillus halotolerans]